MSGSKPAPLAAILVVLVAATIFFTPPPTGVAPATMQAGGLVALAIGMWAFNVLPEHLTGLIFMALVVLLGLAPSQVVFSGFTSATIWLVFGGLFVAEAVRATGLGERLARVMLGRYTGSYLAVLTGVAVVATILAFLMPATLGRVLLMVPILAALSARMGFEPGSNGFNGVQLCGIFTTFHAGIGILPANVPNLVLVGAAETLYGLQINYAEYLLVQFPVMGLLKTVLTIAVILLLFPAHPQRVTDAEPLAPMTAAERRLSILLLLSILLWATDFLHHIKAGWIALVAGILCMMPRVGVLPMAAFNEKIRYAPFFYIAAVLGMGGVMTETGVTRAVGEMLSSVMHLSAGADALNFATLVTVSTLTGVLTTNPAQPALLAPLVAQFAEATGWPIKTVLMTLAVGYSTLILPHMVPPVVVGMQVAGISYRASIRFIGVLAALSLLLLIPIDYLWWHLIGYFG